MFPSTDLENMNINRVWDMRGHDIGLLTRKGGIKMERLNDRKGNLEKEKELLEQWNKGEADGWKWRSNWMGRFVKMWWHKQSVHCYCTLLEVEGNILKLQQKKKRKTGKESIESCQLSARNDRLKCFLFVPSPIHFPPSLARLYLLCSSYKTWRKKRQLRSLKYLNCFP